MVHLSDLDWNRPGEQVIEEYKRGDMVKAQVLDVDIEKERISLGIKQLANGCGRRSGDFGRTAQERGRHLRSHRRQGWRPGSPAGRQRHRDLHQALRPFSRDRDEQRPERFTVGQKVDARVIAFDKKTRKLQVSIKALEIAEEKEAVAQYGSTDSGASLGDILGAALKNREK